MTAMTVMTVTIVITAVVAETTAHPVPVMMIGIAEGTEGQMNMDTRTATWIMIVVGIVRQGNMVSRLQDTTTAMLAMLVARIEDNGIFLSRIETTMTLVHEATTKISEEKADHGAAVQI